EDEAAGPAARGLERGVENFELTAPPHQRAGFRRRTVDAKGLTSIRSHYGNVSARTLRAVALGHGIRGLVGAGTKWLGCRGDHAGPTKSIWIFDQAPSGVASLDNPGRPGVSGLWGGSDYVAGMGGNRVLGGFLGVVFDIIRGCQGKRAADRGAGI